MQVALFNTYESWGGAARAAHRTYTALQKEYSTVRYFVRSKASDDPGVIEVNLTGQKFSTATLPLDDSVRLRYPNLAQPFTDTLFDPGKQVPTILANHYKFDIANIHWIKNFLDFSTFFRYTLLNSIPVVWTLHDMNPFTGGCHYDGDCGKLEAGCGSCPILNSNDKYDLSHAIAREKASVFRVVPDTHLALVAPSHWMLRKAKSSPATSRFDGFVIPNAVDTNVYRPLDKTLLRRHLGLPNAEIPIVLFSAHFFNDRRKGLFHLERFFELNPRRAQICLILVGSGNIPRESSLYACRALFMHNVSDGNDCFLAALYNAADLTLLLSEQDNYPNVALESLACGTPVASFSQGGMADLILDQYNGIYLQNPIHFPCVERVNYILFNPEERRRLSENARQRVIAENSPKVCADKYWSLFASRLNSRRGQ